MNHPNFGVLLVVLVGLGLVLSLVVTDIFFILTYRQPIGRWVQAWSRKYPVLAFLIAAVLGILLGHLYWSTPAPCPVGAQGQVLQAGTDRDCVPAKASPPTDT
jgi:hypothetical protein